MKRLLGVSLAAALLCMSASSWAAPQDRDWGHDRDQDRDQDRDHGHGHNPKDEGRHDNGNHRGWEKHEYRRGERLPDRYYERTYYVTDYDRYHLRRPDRGYRYVRDDDGQIFLTAVATGLIVDIVVNAH